MSKPKQLRLKNIRKVIPVGRLQRSISDKPGLQVKILRLQ
jgi:hypothetical protein